LRVQKGHLGTGVEEGTQKLNGCTRIEEEQKKGVKSRKVSGTDPGADSEFGEFRKRTC